MNTTVHPPSLYREGSEFSQLTFAVKFFPMSALTTEQRKDVLFNRYEFLTKMQVEELCNEYKNKLYFSTEPHQDACRATWEIVWANNNMPTELAWKAVAPERKLKVELRVSRTWGRVAILSFVNRCTAQSVSLV